MFYEADSQTFPPTWFQSIVRGPVDFLVSPASVISSHPERDSCGVSSIEIQSISKLNPFSQQYAAMGFYPSRTIFDWSQNLPDCMATPASEEYHYLYKGAGSGISNPWPSQACPK